MWASSGILCSIIVASSCCSFCFFILFFCLSVGLKCQFGHLLTKTIYNHNYIDVGFFWNTVQYHCGLCVVTLGCLATLARSLMILHFSLIFFFIDTIQGMVHGGIWALSHLPKMSKSQKLCTLNVSNLKTEYQQVCYSCSSHWLILGTRNDYESHYIGGWVQDLRYRKNRDQKPIAFISDFLKLYD